MPTLQSVISELRALPADRLEEVMQLIRSLAPVKSPSEDSKSRILSYAGILEDMTEDDFTAFKRHVRDVRDSMFDRDFGL